MHIGGEGGIRTHGTVTRTGFRDRSVNSLISGLLTAGVWPRPPAFSVTIEA